MSFEYVHQVFVVTIDEEGQVTLDEEIVQFTLGLADTFEGTETLQMGTSDAGDESAGGLSGLYECLDVTRMAGSHLNDGDIVVLSKSEQCLRYTDVVVEVALGGQYVILGGKYGGNELLGGCLAVGARNAHHGNLELPAVLTCQVLEGLEGVVNDNKPWVPLGGRQWGFTYDGVATALFKCLEGIVVAVELVAFQCEEDAPLRAVA